VGKGAKKHFETYFEKEIDLTPKPRRAAGEQAAGTLRDRKQVATWPTSDVVK
jgi:hypothetical protein